MTDRAATSPAGARRPPPRVVLLQWTVRMGAVTAEALARREQASVGSARARLRAAERDGLLSRSRPLAGRPALYTATRAGLRAAGVRGLAPFRIGPANARHAIVCAEVAAALRRVYPDHDVVGERELRFEEHERTAALASAVLGTVAVAGGRPSLHRPDLVLCSRAGALPVAVEVELTVKAPRRLRAICHAWARSRCVAGVLYVAPADVQRPLRHAIAAAAAQERITVLELAALLALERADDPAQRTIPVGS
jgi:hypothetical protein